MKPLGFPQLNGIEHQGHIAMLRKPAGMGLVTRSHFAFGVAAEIEHGGQAAHRLGRAIQVPDDVGAGQALEVDLLHHVISSLQCAGHCGIQRRTRRQGR